MGTVPVTDLYFAYGSNLLDSEIRRHAPEAESVGVAFLAGYRLVFNKHSVSRGGDAASIEKSPSSVVWGYLYRLSDRDRNGLTRREKGVQTESGRGPTSHRTPESDGVHTRIHVRRSVRLSGAVRPQCELLGARYQGSPVAKTPRETC